MSESSTTPTLSHLVELRSRLRADEETPRTTLHRRERDVARTLPANLRSRPDRQLVAWLRRTRAADDHLAHRMAAAQRLVAVLLAVLGLFLGWCVAAALFYYDGTTPVNVVNVLAFFVGVQLLLLVPLAFMLLPARLPGVAAAQETMALLSPGRLWRLAAPLLPQDARARLEELLGVGATHGQVYGDVQKWALLRWSQLFAVAFNVGAILRFVQLIVFTDVAFAWSTTLGVEDRVVYDITQLLALPWAWAWPAAAPTAEFVSATRFFRPQVLLNPASFGGWWPFILMCMLTYGLLPRVAALLVAWSRLRRAVSWALVHTPGAEAVLDRLNNEYVETRAEEAEPQRRSTATDAVEPSRATALPRSARAIVNWAGVPLDDESLRRALVALDAPVLHFGGARGLEEDQRTIASLPRGDAGGVLVATKGWEPPMLEVVDFLADLRRAVGAGVSITVAPLAIDGSRVTAANAAHLAQWQRKVKSAGDAWTSVAAVAPSAAGVPA